MRCPDFYTGAEDLNVGLHACMASPLPAPVTLGKRLVITNSNGKRESQVHAMTPRASQTTLSLLHTNLSCLVCEQVELRLGSGCPLQPAITPQTGLRMPPPTGRNSCLAACPECPLAARLSVDAAQMFAGSQVLVTSATASPG